MTTYKLTYFDMDGGRAEPLRIAFHAGGIPFEDIRLSFPEFGALRNTMRFNSVPTLEMDGQMVTQSNALGRYIGKLVGLYPEDDLQALYCDEATDAVEDLMHYVVQTFGLTGDALKEARAKLVDTRLTHYIKGLGELLGRGGGQFIADGRLTMADLKVFVQVRSLRRGHLDHIPADLVDRLAPELVAHQERVAADPRVVAYYASRKQA